MNKTLKTFTTKTPKMEQTEKGKERIKRDKTTEIVRKT